MNDEPIRLMGHRLDDLGMSWAVIGGLAVSVRAKPRFTQDADIVVVVATDAEAEGLVRQLAASGVTTLSMLEQDAVGRLAAVQVELAGLGPRGGLFDLMFAHSGIESEIVAEAEALEIVPGLVAPVARTGHLLALKVLSATDDRPQDIADIKALLQVADEAEVARARVGLRLITERGYHRGRDLMALFEGYQGRFRPALTPNPSPDATGEGSTS